MKRRQFLSASIAGSILPFVARGQAALPCPPPSVSVEGGQTASTTCVPPPRGTAPQWFLDLAPGTWGTVAGGSGQRIVDHVPNPVPTTGLSGESPNSIATAWTGAAVDQARGEYIMCANGGHADYPGNEAYALTLVAETPKWRRISDPSPANQMPSTASSGVFAEGGGLYSDGRPRAMHSTFEVFGDGRVWFPYLNSVTSGGGGSVNNVASFNRDALGDAATPFPYSGGLGPWAVHGPVPSLNAMLGNFGVAVFDRVGHYVYGLGGNSANYGHYWRVSTRGATLGQSQAFTQGSSFGHWGGWAVHAHDLGIIVAGDHLRQAITVLNLSKVGQSDAWTQISNVTGSGALFGGGTGGVYVRGNRSIAIAHPVNTGSSIRRLQIPTTNGVYNPSGQWTWSTINPGGASIANGPSQGIYSKWNIVEDMGNGESALVVLTNISGPTYVYKIPATGL